MKEAKIKKVKAQAVSPESLLPEPTLRSLYKDAYDDSKDDCKDKPGKLVAKKDFAIHHNEYKRQIKAGEDITDVPEHYHENLRTEGVL